MAQFIYNSRGAWQLRIPRLLHKKAVRPGVRPFVPPEIAEGDFRLMIYQSTVKRFTIKTPSMSEFEYNVFIIIQYYLFTAQLYHTNTL